MDQESYIQLLKVYVGLIEESINNNFNSVDRDIKSIEESAMKFESLHQEWLAARKKDHT